MIEKYGRIVCQNCIIEVDDRTVLQDSMIEFYAKSVWQNNNIVEFDGTAQLNCMDSCVLGQYNRIA